MVRGEDPPTTTSSTMLQANNEELFDSRREPLDARPGVMDTAREESPNPVERLDQWDLR